MDRMSPELWSQLPPEAQAIFLAMVAEIEALKRTVDDLRKEVADLKAQLGKTPRNSSKPPSSEHPHNKPDPPPKKKSGKKRGGQPGHPKHQRDLIPAEKCSQVVPLKPTACRECGSKLAGSDPSPLRHQVWEIPKIEPSVTEFQRHRLNCPCCGTTTCADLPEGVPEGQSGPRLIAVTALLMGLFRQSKRRTVMALEGLFSVPSSPGLTVKHQNIVTAALTPCYEKLKAALPKVDAANLDETGTKQARQKAWIWTAVTAKFTVFVVRLTRAAEVAKELLGEAFAGVITTDRYTGYHWHRQRQLCWAHLLRDFQGLVDAGGKRLGNELLDIGNELFQHWHRARDGTITRRTLRHNILRLSGRMYNALEAGQRCGHARTETLCNELFQRFDQLWMFSRRDSVAPTNNAAERALRHAVIWRKLSFGTQSASGSRFVETMLSVIETCRQNDRSAIDFVTSAVAARFAGKPAPSLLPGV